MSLETPKLLGQPAGYTRNFVKVYLEKYGCKHYVVVSGPDGLDEAGLHG